MSCWTRLPESCPTMIRQYPFLLSDRQSRQASTTSRRILVERQDRPDQEALLGLRERPAVRPDLLDRPELRAPLGPRVQQELQAPRVSQGLLDPPERQDPVRRAPQAPSGPLGLLEDLRVRQGLLARRRLSPDPLDRRGLSDRLARSGRQDLRVALGRQVLPEPQVRQDRRARLAPRVQQGLAQPVPQDSLALRVPQALRAPLDLRADRRVPRDLLGPLGLPERSGV
jgi:hypothetical protein